MGAPWADWLSAQAQSEVSEQWVRYAREPALEPPGQVGVAYEFPITILTDHPWGLHVPTSPNCVALGDSHSIFTVEIYRVILSLCQ